MHFSKAQLQAIYMRDKNIIVSASAGSGKTSVLVERLCQLVLIDHISIDSILAMTFTEDAAGEMKSRLMGRLQQEEQTEYIRQQLALLETAKICTIDSFCKSIVQTYYYLLPISLKMSNSVASSVQSNYAFSKAYQNALKKMDSSLFQSLKNFLHGYGKSETDLQNYVRSFLDLAQSKPNDTEWIKEQMHTEIHSEVEEWFFRYFKNNIQFMIEICKDMKLLTNDETFITKTQLLESCLSHIEHKDYEKFRQQFRIYFLNTPAFKKKYEKEDYSRQQAEFKEYESNIATKLFEESTYIQDEKEKKDLIYAFCTFSLFVKENFAAEKKKMEVIDFNDMEHFAYELLQNPMVKHEVTNKFNMILVDEFQDTNDLQESIIASFARENNVFRVGDIKQSIYGFRQAKPEIMKNHMNKKDNYNTTLVLDENYRSNASIIQFNNDFYSKLMNIPGMESQFEDIDIAKIGTSSQSTQKQYPIRFLYTTYKTWMEMQKDNIKIPTAKSMHNKHRMDLIANDIIKKHKEGFSYKDICILTRNRNEHENLKQVLEAYDIPVLAGINHGFYTNPAIQIIVQALKVIVNPNDDIALTSVLCSPLVNISMDQLSQACSETKQGYSLYSRIKTQEWMQDWNLFIHKKNKFVCEWIQDLYAYNSFYLDHTTSQDKTNLDSFLEIAANFEEQNSLLQFVQEIEQDFHSDSISEAYPYGKEDDVVKIMTMHGSKGLQFPLVYILSQHESRDKNANNPILMDANLGLSFATFTKNKIKRTSRSHIAMLTKKAYDELQEEMRVFYVATTRPQKELVIVDSIASAEDYLEPLTLRTLSKRESYTGWLLHTYKWDPNSIVTFECINELYERPTLQQKRNTYIEYKQYNKPCPSFSSQTASMDKIQLKWKPFELDLKKNTLRGTLFHEIVGQCPYPYTIEAIQNYASEKGYLLSNTDINQLLSLNSNKEYQDIMNHHHQFECSFIVKNEDSISHGFIDLIGGDENNITILDFKTDHVDNERELIDLYKEQLNTYEKSVHKIYPNATICKKIYSFSLQKMILL